VWSADVTLTDAVGNTATDDDVCPQADRSGTLDAVRPEPSGTPVLTATPSIDESGRPAVRAGALLTVTFDLPEPLDLAASDVSLSGTALTPDDDGDTWTRTLDGTEGDGIKDLSVRLVDEAGNPWSTRLDDAIRFDFTAPTASCVVTPTPVLAADVAASVQGVRSLDLEVRPNEPLAGAPTVVSPDLALTVGPVLPRGNAWSATVDLDTFVDTSHVLVVSGQDAVGNPAEGNALCPQIERTVQVRADGPEVVGDPVVDVSPSVEVDGVPWARAGAVVTVSITASEGTVLGTSALLDGRLMTLVGDDTWSYTLTGTEGDGLKGLQITLVDGDGNRGTRTVRDVVGFDFTPPSASCTITPQPANAASSVSLSIQPLEPLAGAPVVTATEVTLGTPTPSGARWVAPITPPAGDDVTFTVDIELTDEVGNTATDDDVCSTADRTGTIAGRAPAPTDVSFDITPSVPNSTGVPQARDGAVATVIFTMADDLDPDRSFVSLSGIPLTSTDGTTWTALLDGTEGDGRKELFATLVDVDGNPATADRPDLAFIADFTAPSVASAVLQRTPYFAPAAGGTVLQVTQRDPLTGTDVEVRVDMQATENLASPPVLTSGPLPLDFHRIAHGGRTGTWELEEVPSGADGFYGLTVRLEDAVGNVNSAASLPVAIRIDTDGELPAPHVDLSDRVVLHRAPWGTAASGGVATTRVEIDDGSLGPGAVVGVVNALGAVVGLGTVDSNWEMDPIALPSDLDEVWVSRLDAAGNLGPAAKVRDVVWTATMNGKKAGDVALNPHRMVHQLRHGAARDARDDLGWEVDGTQLGAVDGQVLTSPTGF